MRAAAAFALALGACARPTTVPAGNATPGLAVTIHADRAGGGGRAFVDDRRWLELPRDGWLELPDVAGDLELGSVVIDLVGAPGGLRTGECHAGGLRGGLAGLRAALGQAVTITTTDGGTVAGTLSAVGPDVALVRDDHLGVVTVYEMTNGTPWPAPGTIVDAVAGSDDRVLGPLLSVGPRTLALTVDGDRVRELSIDAVAAVALDRAAALRCHVTTTHPGRQLVRIAYASPGFAWSAGYRVELPGGDGLTSVAVTTRFTVAAPALATPRPARVRLVAGLPDSAVAPAEVWAGEVTLGGAPVVFASAPVEREARLGLVYRGALGGEPPTSEYWHAGSHGLVQSELALAPLATDVRGPLDVVLDGDGRQVRVALPAPTLDPPMASRLPLTASATLFGYRAKRELVRDLDHIVDEILYSVTNHGDQPATITVEEELRFPTVEVRMARPEGTGELGAGRWRRVIEVPPDGVVRGAVVLQYRTRP